MDYINIVNYHAFNEMISKEEYLDALCHPFENKIIDTCLAILLFCISMGSLALAIHLSIKPYPVSLGYKLSKFLMETDSTACYGQNTKQNRDKSK